MKNIAKDILHLLKFGTLSNTNSNNDASIYKFLVIIIILEILRMAFSIPTYFFIAYFNLEVPKNIISQLFKENGIRYILFMGTVLGPIIEETAFRLGLKYSRLNFALMIGSWFYLKSNSSSFDIKTLMWNYPQINKLIIAFTIIISVYFFLRKQKEIDKRLEAFWGAHPKVILYGFIFSFSFAHILNYDISLRNLFMAPILTLPQMIASIGLSYARLKFGLFHSIIIHSILNLLFIIIYSQFLNY